MLEWQTRKESFTGYWGISLIRNSLDLLPRCELLEKFRYEKEIKTFWWDARFNINSSDMHFSAREI